MSELEQIISRKDVQLGLVAVASAAVGFLAGMYYERKRRKEQI